MAITRSAGTLVARGRTAEVHRWRDGTVVKLFHEWCPASWVAREVEVNVMAARTGIPTPRILDTVTVAGRRGIVFEAVEGQSMLELCRARPWLVVGLARRFAELHSLVHRQEVAALAPLRPSLRDTIQRVRALSPAVRGQVIGVLDGLPDGAVLCHLDFHPDQVLVTPRGLVVIDWLTALRGEPLADVARTAVLLSASRESRGGRARRAVDELWRGLFRRVYLARYRALHPGAPFEKVGSWAIPMAAARLREGIACEEEPLLAMIRRSLARRALPVV